ncbi:MAG TPA: hypothetical protein VI957_03270 [Candidatus Paceibacterota bacterium]
MNDKEKTFWQRNWEAIIEDEKKVEMENFLSDFENRPREDVEMVFRSLERYEAEARKNSYKADPSALIEFIAQKMLLVGATKTSVGKEGCNVIDLGSGSGDLVRGLASRFPGAYVRGIDMSPTFVRKNRDPYTSGRLGLIDSPRFIERVRNKSRPEWLNGNVVSVLTLDRVTDPRQLLENMAQFKGAKILATLLPIVAEDDNPSRQGENKIVYTRPEKRIVPGVEESEDRKKLAELLNQLWRENVLSTKVPYVVTSSGDRQEYTLDVFFTRPK